MIRSETLVPSHRSCATGFSKLQGVPHSMLRVLAQATSGGVVSRMVMVWLHEAEFWQASTTFQVRVALNVLPQKPSRLVMVDMMVSEKFVPWHASMTDGGVNAHGEPHSMDSSLAQVMAGAVRSTRVIVWLHVATF